MEQGRQGQILTNEVSRVVEGRAVHPNGSQVIHNLVWSSAVHNLREMFSILHSGVPKQAQSKKNTHKITAL